MFLALFELSLFALAFWVFLILLIVGVAFDRKGLEQPKWYLIGFGLIAVAIYFWPDFTFFGSAHVDALVEGGKEVVKAHERVVLWNIVTSSSFWVPVGSFLGIGLVYSVLEFGLAVRKAARLFSEAWQNFLIGGRAVPRYDSDGKVVEVEVTGGNSRSPTTRPAVDNITYRDMLHWAQTKGAEYRYFQEAVDAIKEFAHYNKVMCNQNDIIGLVIAADKLGVEPKVNKAQLAEHIGAWTFLWPVYAINLIVGDLFTEIFITLANFLASISGRLVKVAFKDVFTLK